MSNYTSENTKVLATHVQDGNNKRMLLLHTMQNGSHEYVIGSYFQETVEISNYQEYERVEYSWDWGHYFDTLDKAALYWLQEVRGMRISYDASGA